MDKYVIPAPCRGTGQAPAGIQFFLSMDPRLHHAGMTEDVIARSAPKDKNSSWSQALSATFFCRRFVSTRLVCATTMPSQKTKNINYINKL